MRIQETQKTGNSYSTITATIDYGNNGDTAVNSGTLNIKLDSRLTFVDAYIANDITGRRLSLIEKAYADSTNTAW